MTTQYQVAFTDKRGQERRYSWLYITQQRAQDQADFLNDRFASISVKHWVEPVEPPVTVPPAASQPEPSDA